MTAVAIRARETNAVLPEPEPAVDVRAFVESARELLTENVLRYRNYGPYWFFVKALLRRFYSRHELPFLAGTYQDAGVSARVSHGGDLKAWLAGAVESYRHNASFNLGRNLVEDDDGDRFTLFDPDVEG
jgi:hypothetical protein